MPYNDSLYCEGPEWLSTTDAAKLARIHVDAMRDHRQRGEIVGYNGLTGEPFSNDAVLGGYLLRFKRSEVIAMTRRLHPWLLTPLSEVWKERARCRGLSTEDSDRIFFPEPPSDYEEAQSYCRACPVKRDCLEWASKVGCAAGMFGGATGRQLEKYNYRWRRTGVLPKLCAMCGDPYSNLTDYCSTECANADR